MPEATMSTAVCLSPAPRHPRTLTMTLHEMVLHAFAEKNRLEGAEDMTQAREESTDRIHAYTLIRVTAFP